MITELPFGRIKKSILAALALSLVTTPLITAAQAGSNVPPALSQATNLGHADPAREINVAVWLTMKNPAEFDRSLDALYEPGSPTYHKWMTEADLARYAPAPTAAAAVTRELQSHGLTVIPNESDRFLVRAHGPVANVESAFHTQINNFEKNGKQFYSHILDASLGGEAAGYVAGISGLSSFGMQPMLKPQLNPRTGQAVPPVPLRKAAREAAATGGIPGYTTTDCFAPPQSVTLTNNGGLPTGSYFGNVYDQNPLPCGYGASGIQAHYGLTAAYEAGLKGDGQTIVIVEAYGSPTILADANTFSQLNGLPPLNSSNFQILYPAGKPFLNFNETIETSIDVEWAHAVAPNAKIIVLNLPSVDDLDFEYAIFYTAFHHLGSVLSYSYGVPEVLHGPLTLQAYNQVMKFAAASGISVNCSSGDGGDEGLGTPVGASISPADSPYATSVGGTSLNVPNGPAGTPTEVGWGNNLTFLSFALNAVLDPPLNLGFIGGAGGGESVFFAKPGYQKNLPGTGRQQPDVSALADPYTGGAIVYTDPFLKQQVLAVYGGTSLAAPIFSGIWSLANQKAGHLLGRAAPLVSRMSPTEVNDILPITSSPSNVAGIIFDSNGAKYYSPTDLLAPLSTTGFFSALWNIQNSGEYTDLSFGTDSSLQVTPGWDNVTGFGTPNGLAFINAAASGK